MSKSDREKLVELAMRDVASSARDAETIRTAALVSIAQSLAALVGLLEDKGVEK